MAENNGTSVLWFLAGLGIGAVAGILYAPDSGEQTRKALRAKAKEHQARVKHHAKNAGEQATKWVNHGREFVARQSHQLRTAYAAGRRKHREATISSAGAATNT